MVYKWLISKKAIIFQGFQSGSNIFQGGPTFSKGLISIETTELVIFQGWGVLTPYPPSGSVHVICIPHGTILDIQS